VPSQQWHLCVCSVHDVSGVLMEGVSLTGSLTWSAASRTDYSVLLHSLPHTSLQHHTAVLLCLPCNFTQASTHLYRSPTSVALLCAAAARGSGPATDWLVGSPPVSADMGMLGEGGTNGASYMRTAAFAHVGDSSRRKESERYRRG
jgi:hypothetical protein